MGIWGSTLKRSNTGELRREDDLTNIIKEFFLNNQQQVSSYEIYMPGAPGEDWIVDVDGSLRIDAVSYTHLTLPTIIAV